VLQKLGVSSEIICPDIPKVSFSCPFEIAKYKIFPDLLIAVDCAALDRCFYPEEFRSLFFINIDHHVSNTNFASLNIVRAVPSACEVLVALLCDVYGEDIFDCEIAEAFLFGILSDTLIFSTSEVSKQTFAVTEFLLGKGADYQKVKCGLGNLISVQKLQLWSQIIMSSEIKLADRVLLLKLDKNLIKEYKLESLMFAGFINRVAGMVDTDLVIFISEFEENTIDVSMRSKITDVALLAQSFSGGGHKRAAGFKIKGMSMLEVEKILLAKIEAYQ
jgi:phosphoesterase RecJ-like protein